MSGTLHSATMETPAAPFTLVASADAVRAAGFTTDVDRLLGTLSPALRTGTHRHRTELGPITDAVARYLSGELSALDEIPVVQSGGPFTTAAWDAMRRIRVGSTVTYQQLAAVSGRADAVRAAGAACASNRIALVVPCHRVLRTGGAPGGYLWGLPVKRWLLRHEGTPSAVDDRQLALPFPL